MLSLNYKIKDSIKQKKLLSNQGDLRQIFLYIINKKVDLC